MTYFLIPVIVGIISAKIGGSIMKSNRSLLFNSLFVILGGFILQSLIFIFFMKGGLITSVMASILGGNALLYIERLQYEKIGKLSLTHNYLGPFTIIILLFINVILNYYILNNIRFAIPLLSLIVDYFLVSFGILIILFYSFVENKALRKKSIFICGVIPIIFVNIFNWIEKLFSFV